MGSVIQRKGKNGRMIYRAEVRRRGHPTAYKSFSRITDARVWIQDMESGQRAGRYLPQAEAQRHRLSEAIDRYIEEELPKKPKSYIDQKRELLWFSAQIGSRLLADVSPALLNEVKGRFFRELLGNGLSRKPQSWNRYLSALSCVFQMCVGDWEWMEYNPARRVKREREAPGRVRFLTDDERTRLLDVCQRSRSLNLYPLVVLALSTGMRRSELNKLTWSQVDLSKGVIQLAETKNGERRRVSVRGLALDLLRQHGKIRRIDTSYLFSR